MVTSNLMVTPPLVTWAGQLTENGVLLAAWMQQRGIEIPADALKPGSLIRPAAQYFAARPDEAAALWQQYVASTAAEAM